MKIFAINGTRCGCYLHPDAIGKIMRSLRDKLVGLFRKSA